MSEHQQNLAAIRKHVDGAINAWRERREARGRRDVTTPPYPADSPCYYCDLIDSVPKSNPCAYCIHNPQAVIYRIDVEEEGGGE